jgi:hypothetical protein
MGREEPRRHNGHDGRIRSVKDLAAGGEVRGHGEDYQNLTAACCIRCVRRVVVVFPYLYGCSSLAEGAANFSKYFLGNFKPENTGSYHRAHGGELNTDERRWGGWARIGI